MAKLNESVLCNKCNAHASINAVFCPKCGNQLFFAETKRKDPEEPSVNNLIKKVEEKTSIYFTFKDNIRDYWFLVPGIVILIIAISDHPYSYYQLTKWITTINASILAFTFSLNKRTFWMWVFIGLGILFNPIAPIYLKQETWQIFNVVGAVLFFLALGFLDAKEKRNDN